MHEGAVILQKGRYELINRTRRCGETIGYLALDRESGEKVRVYEFFSDSIMQRRTDGTVCVREGCEVQYKSLLSDYEELCAYRMALPEDLPLTRPVEVFKENGTAYAVYKILDMQPLDDYLARCGKIDWLTVKKRMGPLVALVSRLHSDGIYHRGISPETVFIDNEGKLFLTSLCLPPARTSGSEIEATLYFGYSAPEQYSSSSWQGTWTDVYALAALCYRMVTGTTPVEWRQRSAEHPLRSPDELAYGVPEYVAQAIIKGLCVDLSQRYHTPDEFWCALLSPNQGTTIRYSVDELHLQSDADEQPVFGGFLPTRKSRIIFLAVGMLVVIMASMALSAYLARTYLQPIESSSVVSEPEGEDEASEPVEEEELPEYVPLMLYHNIEEILLHPDYQEQYVFGIERVFSEDQRAGTIVGQNPPARTPYSEGMTLTLVVSKGTERTTMPKVEGLTLAQAVSELERKEIVYIVQYTEHSNGSMREGIVIDSSIAPDTTVYRSADVAMITVYGSEPKNPQLPPM